MKKNVFDFCKLLMLSVLMILSSCSKEEPSIAEKGKRDGQQLHVDDPVLSRIKNLGFSDSTIVDMGEYYLVEGDITFPKNAKVGDKEHKGGRIDQATTDVLVAQDRTVIKVRIDPGLYTDTWYNGLLFAVNDWTEITDCRVQFLLNNYTGEPDITVRSAYFSDNRIIASADFPANGLPGREVRVNLNFRNQDGSIPSISQKRYNLVHELGHTIGFRHTNWQGRGESSANGVPGTPNSGSNPDPSSVMNGGTAAYLWNGFSYYDRVAAQTVYPENPLYPQNAAYSSWLLSPNGNENLYLVSGETDVNITWNTALISTSNVKLDLYMDGSYWLSINSSTPNDGSYTWRASNGTGNGLFRVKISNPSNSSVFDFSNASFDIDNP